MDEGICDLSSMPEGVIANILSLTTPSDACRLSAVSTIFAAAAQSDTVWDGFLPTDWKLLISRRKPTHDLNFDPISSSKKDIFFSLCYCPLLIDDGNKSFSLDKWSGKRCIMLGARDLSIYRSDTPVCWRWEPRRESRFAEVVVLIHVCRLEISGKMSCKMLSFATTYAAYFVFKMFDRHHGFDIVPADAAVGIVGGECCTNTVCLDPCLGNARQKRRRLGWMERKTYGKNMSRLERRPKERHDGWLEIELGEFHNEGGDDEVKISLMEVNCNHSKGGLIVQGIEIRPKFSPA